MAREKAPLPAAAPADDTKKAIDTAIANLNNVMQAASAQMYQGGAQPGAGAQAGAQPGADNGAKADDNIQDADFEEVK